MQNEKKQNLYLKLHIPMVNRKSKYKPKTNITIQNPKLHYTKTINFKTITPLIL